MINISEKGPKSNQEGFVAIIVIIIILAIALGVIAVKFDLHPLIRIKDQIQSFLK